MFAIFAFVCFVLAFVFIGAGIAVSTAWLTPPALVALGLAFLALHHSKFTR